MTEDEVIRFLERFLPSAPGLVQGPGDDCAVVDLGDRWWLLTADAMVEGVHFSLSYFTPYFLGRKLAAVNLSDVAAMGGQPRFALLTLAFPAPPEEDFLRDFLEGLTSKLAAYGAHLVGGDTVKGPALQGDLALIGEAAAGAVVFRQGARPGDLIFVSRPLGASAMALELFQKGEDPPEPLKRAHLDPEPEVELGRVLAEEALASAMLDVSDGLLKDLSRLCCASGVGAEVEEEAVPLAVDELPGLSRPLRDYALFGGEDFALLFTVPREKERALRSRLASLSRKPHRLGRIVPGEKLLLRRADGAAEEVSPEGFDHFA